MDLLNRRQSPINDAELSEYLTSKELNFNANTDLAASVKGVDYVMYRHQQTTMKKQISLIRRQLRR